MKKISNILVILLLCYGCNNNDTFKISFTSSNPTSFTFNSNIDTIKSVVLKEFGGEKYYGFTLFSKYDCLSKMKLFKIDSNYNDFILEEFINNNKYLSKVYYKKNGEASPYSASYHIHLIKNNDSSTKVSIITSEAKVLKGLSKLPTLPHFAREWIYIPVKPTTVEEYEILLILGKALGVKNMPPLKIPEKVNL